MADCLIDITLIDTQYSVFKIQNKRREKDLLKSIAESGIRDPLLGVLTSNGHFILIDGFKRYRCGLKLHIGQLPFEVLAIDKAMAMIKILNLSNSKSLHILEQSKFIKELYEHHHMGMNDIAYALEKSRHWVGSRLQLLKELTPFMEQEIFNDRFPAWNALGILHQVKRLSLASGQEIDRFVKVVSNKGLSVREIDLLANGYFRGCSAIRQQIEEGNLNWTIKRLKDRPQDRSGFNDGEKNSINDLEILQKYIGRIIFKFPFLKVENNDFFSVAELLAGGVLSKLEKLKMILLNFIQGKNGDQ